MSSHADLQQRIRRARDSARGKNLRFLHKLQGKLQRRYKTPVFKDEDLVGLHVVRSAPLDIDDENPLDLEPMYFTPGHMKEAREGIEVAETAWEIKMGYHKPIEWRHSWTMDKRRVRKLTDASHDNAFSNSMYFQGAAHRDPTRLFTDRNLIRWESLPHVPQHWKAPEKTYWRDREGRPVFHYASVGHTLGWSRGAYEEPHPDVPHTIATVCDSVRPRGDGLLRSELLAAVLNLLTQAQFPDKYVNHKIFPTLIVSFHGRFSARIVQACLVDRRLIVRASRIIDLHVRAMTPDMVLLVRWLNSRPVGEVHYPPADPTQANTPDIQVGCAQADDSIVRDLSDLCIAHSQSAC